MIYFDNAATTYPKPEIVRKALAGSLVKYGANPGRSGYEMALETAAQIYRTRLAVSRFFNMDDENRVIFTQNCTASLNTVIKGLAKKGSHFIISDLEHNAVVRPLETLKQRGICTYSIAHVDKNDSETVENFKSLIKENTVAFVCTAASNVFGKMLPINKLTELAHRHSILIICDAAQTAGVVDIDLKRDAVDYLCVAAHKGLYCPMSTGLLLMNNTLNPDTLIEGGTGNMSSVFTQPDDPPERYESGTLNVPLISTINSGLYFVNNIGTENIYNHEMGLIKRIYSQLSEIKGVRLYTDPFSETESFVPLLSFNIEGMSSEQTAQKLADAGIAVRAGYHCAYLAHKAYGTADFGTVRIAPSVFTDNKDVKILLNSIFKIAKDKNI